MDDFINSLTPEQMRVVIKFSAVNFVTFVAVIWKAAKYISKNEYDKAVFGEALGFEKGKELAPKLRKKRGISEPPRS